MAGVGAGAVVTAGVVVTVDPGLLHQGESAVWTVMIGDQGVLGTALSQNIAHLRRRGGSTAFLLMAAEARKKGQARHPRSASKRNAMDQIIVEAQKETIAGAL